MVSSFHSSIHDRFHRPSSATQRQRQSHCTKTVVTKATKTSSQSRSSIESLNAARNKIPLVAPSIAKCDLLNVQDEIQSCLDAKLFWFHCPVQDGRLTKRFGDIGPGMVKALRTSFKDEIFLDVKLTVNDIITSPAMVQAFVNAGADCVSVHYESASAQLAGVLDDIRANSCAAGVVLNPATKVENILMMSIMTRVEVIVVMLVSPGWGGAKDVKGSVEKVRAIRKWCVENGIDEDRRPLIEVDGGVDEESARVLIEAGADVLVAGGAVFKSADKRHAIEKLLRK
jgi:ribulose-phosphate 3-epimerase